MSLRIIIKSQIANEVEGVLRAAGKFTGLGGLELYQWRPETNKCVLAIFTNLIDNALKYGGKSLTRISIGYEDSESLHIFPVIDNGKGLKGADSEKIFEVFQHNETSRGVEGAGLGLAIVKEIAEQQCGRVWVEPRGKKGTTFCVSISKNL